MAFLTMVFQSKGLRRFMLYAAAVFIVSVLVGLIAAAIHHDGFVKGQKMERDAWVAKQADAKELAHKDAEKRQEKIEKINAAGVAKEQRNRVIYKTITKEVVRYASSPESRLCNHSAEWVRIHDSAARPNQDPVAVDGSAGGATDGETIEAVTENYESCNAWRGRLIDLQAVVRASGCFVFTETGK